MEGENLESFLDELATEVVSNTNENLRKEREEQGFESSEQSQSYADKVVRDIENEYKGIGTAVSEREKEKNDLTALLEKKKTQLKNTKNVKNYRLVEVNRKNAEKRKMLRQEIESIKDRLYEISIEEKGSDVSSTKMVDTSIQEKLGKSSLRKK